MVGRDRSWTNKPINKQTNEWIDGQTLPPLEHHWPPSIPVLVSQNAVWIRELCSWAAGAQEFRGECVGANKVSKFIHLFILLAAYCIFVFYYKIRFNFGFDFGFDFNFVALSLWFGLVWYASPSRIHISLIKVCFLSVTKNARLSISSHGVAEFHICGLDHDSW